MCNHKWIGNRRKEMLLWVETCQCCKSLRYGWKFGGHVEYTYPRPTKHAADRAIALTNRQTWQQAALPLTQVR